MVEGVNEEKFGVGRSLIKEASGGAAVGQLVRKMVYINFISIPLFSLQSVRCRRGC